MKNYVIDIETDADYAFLTDSGIEDAWKIGIEAPANYKDPEKIENYIANAITKKLEGAKNNPLSGRIVAVHVADFEGGAWMFAGEDEAVIMLDLADFFFDQKGGMSRLIGWNVRRRTLPYLAVKVAQHKINWPSKCSLNAKDWKNVVDLSDDLGLVGEFDWWCLRFGLESGDGDATKRVEAMVEMSKCLSHAYPWKFSQEARSYE